MLPTAIKSVKTYAVLETTVELKNVTPAELMEFLKTKKFRGNVTVNYSQGGITNVVTHEHIALSMEQLESLCQKA
jgi:hypothetical protein